jgi:hypothetical protein
MFDCRCSTVDAPTGGEPLLNEGSVSTGVKRIAVVILLGVLGALMAGCAAGRAFR